MPRPSKAWRRHLAHRLRPQVVELESRIVPYSVTGNSWVHPELVSISFQPNGTDLGFIDGNGNAVISTLSGTFDALWPSAVWQKEFLRAAQVWAQQTNINFKVVADNGAVAGGGANQQGDPNYGDIRIGGYQSSPIGWLASAYYAPQANNYSIAGDIHFNSAQNFNIGSDYDLFTVAAHEIGHALGLGHGFTTSVMAANYPGLKTGLTTDDINGVRTIYSNGLPRSEDRYNNHTFATAPLLGWTASKQTMATGLDVTTMTQLDYFKFVYPSGGTGSLKVLMQSTGLSLLSPRLWVFNSAFQQIGYWTNYGSPGSSIDQVVNGMVAGQTYYVRFAGAEPTTPFGTGAYAISMSAGTLPPLVIPVPNTTTANGSPIVFGGSINQNDHDEHGAEDSDGGPQAAEVRHEATGSIDAALPNRVVHVISRMLGQADDILAPVDDQKEDTLIATDAESLWLDVWATFGEEAEDEESDEFAINVKARRMRVR